MAQIDDLIATYMNAVETEGKSVRTIKSYRDSLATFRLVGRRLGFPGAVEDHDVTHVYAFLAELRARRGRSGRATTTPIYQNDLPPVFVPLPKLEPGQVRAVPA